MNGSRWVFGTVVGLAVGLVGLIGCSQPKNDGGDAPSTNDGDGGTEADKSSVTPNASGHVAPATLEDVDAAKKLLDRLGPSAQYTMLPDNVMTGIVIPDGSSLSAQDIALFGRLTDLETLKIFNDRSLGDELASQLAGLKSLKTVALTNSVIGDATVEMIVQSFPKLINLDLSYNTNITHGALKTICELSQLERLTLIQNRFNDLGTSRLTQLKRLRVLDLRGNMEAGDMTMEILGTMPKLAALKHRSTAVTDFGMEYLAESKTLKALLMQDFVVTDQAGESLAKLDTMRQLEIFRCQGFGSQGVLALGGMQLTRLKLRDLPMVDDSAMDVFQELPELKRLELHENDSISDDGLKNLAFLKSLEILDIWSVPRMTDATVDVIATLPNLKQLSIRSTDVTDAAIDRLLAMPKLQSLTLKENGMVTAQGLKKLSTKKWAKLDVGK